VAPALADEAAPPAKVVEAPGRFFVEPLVGSNLYTRELDEKVPYLPATIFPVCVRTGWIYGPFGADLKLGWVQLSGPEAESESTKSMIGFDVRVLFAKRELGTPYVITGFDYSKVTESYGLYDQDFAVRGGSLAGGLKLPVRPGLAFGPEIGLRYDQADNQGEKDTSLSLTVGFTGSWESKVRVDRDRLPPVLARNDDPLPETTAAPSPTHEETPTPTPIASAPTPTPPASSTRRAPCATWVTDGWFEPMQGVWQDDEIFDDRPGKQLVRVDTGDGRVHYRAELAMIMGRHTVIGGVHHYRKENGDKVTVNSRATVVLKGMSNCKEKYPVRFRFMKEYVWKDGMIATSPLVGNIPLEGEALPAYTAWEVSLPAPLGIPADVPFQFERGSIESSGGGKYILRAQLVRANNASTGLEMSVEGWALAAQAPKMVFVPVILSRPESTGDGIVEQIGKDLLKDADRLASELTQYGPDMFPLAPGQLPTEVRSRIRNFESLEIPDMWLKLRRYNAVAAAMNDTLSAEAFLEGAGRVVAVMTREDFKNIAGPDSDAVAMTVSPSVDVKPKNRSARSLSWKVVFSPNTETWDTIAHEVLHTLPEGWASTEMVAECGLDYHNRSVPWADGIRLARGAKLERELRRMQMPLMGPVNDLEDMWITQCTYWHLVKMMTGYGPPDPPVSLVRVWLGNPVNAGGALGEIKPVYDLMGSVDLPALAKEERADWSIVAKDAAGKRIGGWKISPEFVDSETGLPRAIVSQVFRIPAVPVWSSLELVGPGGATLASKKRSAKPPTVSVSAPSSVATGTSTLDVSWKGAGEKGLPLRYTVLYAKDDSPDWLSMSFEQAATTAKIDVDPEAKRHRVRVLVTDGTRSGEETATTVVP